MDAMTYIIGFLIFFIFFILPIILKLVRRHMIYSDKEYIKCRACKGKMVETARKLCVLPISLDDTHVETARYYINKAEEISDESQIPTGRQACRMFLLQCQDCGIRKVNVVDFLKVRDSEIFKGAADYAYEELEEFFLENREMAASERTVSESAASESITPENDAQKITLPRTATEKWITATYAIWSEYAMDSWKYISGVSDRYEATILNMQDALKNSWGIESGEELLEEVEALKIDYLEGDMSDDRIYYAGWDLCRACQILGMGYVAGFIEREEMVRESVKVAPLMRRYFSSWEELYNSYLTGYSQWRNHYDEEFDSDARADIDERTAIARKFLNMQDGPCSLDWNMEL